MKILLAGATGLIGTALRQASPEIGFVCLTRRHQSETGPAPQHFLYWDPATGELDLAQVAELGPFDAIVNLAGEPIGQSRMTPEIKRRILESRVRSTRLLAELATKLDPHPKVLVNASAIGYYGSRDDETLTEESSPGEGFLPEVCKGWEKATAPATAAGVRTVMTRTGIVLAREGGVLGKLVPLFKAGLGARLGNGRQWMSWVSIEDVTGVLRYALENEAIQGPVNLVAPNPVTNAVFTKKLASALHRPALAFVPASILRASLGKVSADELLLTSQKVLPKALEKSGYQFRHQELGPALAALFPRS
jgi:uncharacterized protein (TIGR01777 family)